MRTITLKVFAGAVALAIVVSELVSFAVAHMIYGEDCRAALDRTDRLVPIRAVRAAAAIGDRVWVRP